MRSDSARAESVAFTNGMRRTRSALGAWRRDPSALVIWFGWAGVVAAGLLTAVWLVSLNVTIDETGFAIIGGSAPFGIADLPTILGRNLLVLALHATACVAGFIAGSSMREVAEGKQGLSRVVHEKAGPIAIAWVVIVTVFSLLTQSFGLGFDAAAIANQLEISSGVLILSVLPHALLELTAVFLPLAAWLVASRRGEWDQLLAATLVTTFLALPMLIVAAVIEVNVWPEILESISPVEAVPID